MPNLDPSALAVTVTFGTPRASKRKALTAPVTVSAVASQTSASVSASSTKAEIG